MAGVKGLDEFREKIEQLRHNAEQIGGEHSVPLAELFSPAFMRQHTSSPDFETFCRESGLDASSTDGFEATPLEQLDTVTKQSTAFATWDEMVKAAAADWAKRRLFDGFER